MFRKDIAERLDRIFSYVEKTLHVSATHREAYSKRSARTYYPLNDGWALTNLDNGLPFYVNTYDRHVTPWVIMGGHWEPNVDRVLTGYAQPGDLVLDVGAHIGYFTIKLASRVGAKGRVIAFEPNPEVTEYVLANIRLNGFIPFVSLNKVALGDVDGMASLSRAAHAMASANIVGDLDESVVEVPLRRLDHFDLGRPVDLIKLDAEGSEVMVLKGAEKTLRNAPDCAIVMELGLQRWERFAPLERVTDYCGGAGRELYGIHQDGTVELMDWHAARTFLRRGHFQEEYFLIANPDQVERKIPELIRRK